MTIYSNIILKLPNVVIFAKFDSKLIIILILYVCV